MFKGHVFNKTNNPDRTITGFNNQIRSLLNETDKYPKEHLIKKIADDKYKINRKLYEKIKKMVYVNPNLKQERVIYDGFCETIKLPNSRPVTNGKWF
mgnify:CR=1 FL=1